MILAWVKDKQGPSEKEMFLVSPAVVLSCTGQTGNSWFKLMVYCSGQNDKLEGVLLVLPGRMRSEALKILHEIPSAGHQGIARTKAPGQTQLLLV
jgi:aminoglycoside phosphotransferase (APT) family kinase protein